MTPEQQQFLAEKVAKRAIHLTAIESFAESKREAEADIKKEFGKDFEFTLDALANEYIKGQKLREQAQQKVDKLKEVEAQTNMLKKYISLEKVYDEADKYL